VKRKPSSKPAEDDLALFRAEVHDVAPLPPPARVLHPPRRQQPLPYQRIAEERAALADSLSPLPAWELGLETGEELVYLRSGIPQQVLKNLRRGHWVIQDELDLHGLTSVEARALLVDCLAAWISRGLRCVRIIHGKGLRSRNREPVLKRKVAAWLMQRDQVLAFCQARQADGGGGAMIVLLKAAR
jgi:DNA-nicking Smr family endonuclease